MWQDGTKRFNETGPMKARKAGIFQSCFPLMSCFNETGPMKARKAVGAWIIEMIDGVLQ